MSEITPINKGNYDMETEERLRKYEKNRALGWEEEYAKYRHRWSEWPQNQILAAYPIQVDIELSTVCNLQCPMCYTTTAEFSERVKRAFMNMDLFHKIVDEVAGKVTAARLSLRGEPTLHPQFIECVKYCKERGIKEVSFLTNLSTMTKEFFTKLCKANIDWITVSVDGLKDAYETVRKPLKFQDTLQKLRNMQEIKKANGLARPVIKVQGIWPAIKSDPSGFYNTLAPITDMVAFNPLIDYLDNDEDIIYEPEFSCPQLYQRLVIGADGIALACSNDEKGLKPVGDANIETIAEIWRGEKLSFMRKLHAEGRFKEIELCRRCYLPRATEDSEEAAINGRKIKIKNYVGRSQVIGS